VSTSTNAGSRWTPYALSLPSLALFGLMVLLPLALTGLLSFQEYSAEKGVGSGFTLASYAHVLGDSYYYEIFFRTGWIAALVTLICVLVGAPEAYVLSRMRAPWRSILLLVVLAPLLVSFGLGIVLTNVLQQVFSADSRSIGIGSLGTSSVPLAPDLSVGTLAEATTIDADLLVTTIPGEAQTPDLLALCADVPAVFEVVYDPWPTPLARTVLEDGRVLVAGLDLLAHQAVGQVQRMTGKTVPVDLLRQAGTDELTRRAVQLSADLGN
jgi:hypothetical protein